MRLNLKEEPREWRNFMLLFCVVLGLLAAYTFRRGLLSASALTLAAAAITAVAVLACLVPGWFRTPYRAGMTVSFRVGQVVQTALLMLIYCACVVPLAYALRLARKDPLEIRKGQRESYWRPARPTGSLEKQF